MSSEKAFYIKSIDISGLFGTERIHWELRQDVNILGGPNGSGKSTILKACFELVSKGEIEDIKCVRLIDSLSITFTNGWSLLWNKERVNDINKANWASGYNLSYSVNDYERKADYFCSVQLIDEKEAYKELDIIEKSTKVVFINSFEQRISDAIRISKLPEGTRENDSTLLDVYIKEELNRRNEIYSGAYESLLGLLQKEGNVKLEDLADFKDYFQLMNACARFFEDYLISISNKLVFRKGDSEIPYSSLSMGEKQLLLILLMVTNTQKQPFIFIMDEPDLGMHVDWKKKLIKEIHQLNPNMQLIVSTHAPSVVTGWNDCVKEIGQITLKGED